MSFVINLWNMQIVTPVVYTEWITSDGSSISSHIQAVAGIAGTVQKLITKTAIVFRVPPHPFLVDACDWMVACLGMSEHLGSVGFLPVQWVSSFLPAWLRWKAAWNFHSPGTAGASRCGETGDVIIPATHSYCWMWHNQYVSSFSLTTVNSLPNPYVLLV